MVRRNGEMLKRDISIRPRNCDLCYKCGKPGHFMKDCPILKQEFSKNHHEKTTKTNTVPVKDFKRKRSADNMMRHAFAAWGDSSSESEDKPDTGDSSMIAVEADVLITTFHSLVEDRNSLTLELGESEQTRDDLVAVVTDHKKTIKTLRKEKSDLLTEIAYLRETIVKPWTKSKPESSNKGKVIASEEHIRLENEVKAMRFRMSGEIEKNELLHSNLERVKNDFEKSLKWTWSSEATTALHTNNCENMQGAGFQREKTPHNPHITDLVTGEIVLMAKRYKNIYVVDFKSLQNGDLSCLKAVDDEAKLWHKRLGHANFSLLNKLIQKDLVHGLPMSQFKMQKVCDACARGKHVKSSIKPKRDNAEEDQDGEPPLVPSEIINMTNGKADMMSHVKEPNEDNAASSSTEPSTSITTTKAEERVVDAVQGTPLAPERMVEENYPNISFSS
uniref:CCHC-type domain-containing protein n=1 Tax=Nicotiana tabacum TaxID=4097 RepID=A0A1S3Z8T8_TOBAC|nr:PREDICTED: uncharacterized protein LOC107784205 [Nicotiana tabacum]